MRRCGSCIDLDGCADRRDACSNGLLIPDLVAVTAFEGTLAVGGRS